jgi:Fic family protein
MSDTSRIDIPGTLYCYEDPLLPQLQELANRVQTLRSSGRLTPEVLGRIRRYFRIKNIYHSNAIEGNTLNLGETQQIVQYGLTLTGKPLKDQAEAKNLAHAVDYLEELASQPSVPLTESDVRQIHTLVLRGINDENAGRYRTVDVEISGSQFKPPTHSSVPAQMQEFGVWLSDARVPVADLQTALLQAAVAHTWFVSIHPFLDGNGRVARLLMNLLLMRSGYPIAIITKEDRLRYYDALEQSQGSDLTAFLALVAECVHESLEEYEAAAQEQREMKEWAASLAERFTERELARNRNQYEVWRSAMELLRSYFKQAAELLNQSSSVGHVYFKDFGTLEFEKYLSLRQGESVKKTWFFRIDFRQGDLAARYMFFFGFPGQQLKPHTDVTLHVSREEPSGSWHYERLDYITAPNVPDLREFGYVPKEEQFVAREVGRTARGKIEPIGKRFFDEVIAKHFAH